jgi:sn-glycerol 3-phosphate transport system substrate-binding protein
VDQALTADLRLRLRRRSVLAAAPAALAMARPTRAAERTEITVWHAMGSAPGEEFAKLIDRFNAGQGRVQVSGLYKGAYKELMVVMASAWRAGEAPHAAQIFEVGTETMLRSGPVIKPVWQLARDTGVTLDPEAYIPSVRGYYSDAGRRLMSAPFNSSTAICWYNLDSFAKAGLPTDAFPATWPELVALARTIRDKLPYATGANGFNGLDAELRINSPPHVRNLQRLLDMAKEATFHYTGRDGSGDGAFLSGDAAITFSSSALRGSLVSSAKFRWAPAFLPFDPQVIAQPINSVIGGASFWVLTAPKRSSDEYRAIAEFLRFLAQPDSDAEWSAATGYVPITHAGYAMAEQHGDLANGADLPVRQLSRGRITDNSRGFHLGRMPEIRTIIEEECEKALNGEQDAKAALDAAVTRGNKVLRDFQRSVAH